MVDDCPDCVDPFEGVEEDLRKRIDVLESTLEYACNWLADIRNHGHAQAEVALITIHTRTGIKADES